MNECIKTAVKTVIITPSLRTQEVHAITNQNPKKKRAT